MEVLALLSASSYLSLPSKPGVYRFLDENGSILYVGKAKDLKNRVSSYFTHKSYLEEKTAVLVSQIKNIDFTIVESELESLLLEAYYIKKYKPKYNAKLTDDKSYPLIRITITDKYPVVLFARRTDDQNSLYFGPYPSSQDVKTVLKMLRRIFPFQAVKNHPNRICLYHHLGRCPCPPVFDSPELQKMYKKNIKRIIRILEGETRQIIKELEKERDEYSSAEKFEEAKEAQRKIDSLTYVTQPVRSPFEYDINPNLRTDMRKKELDGLQEVLNAQGYNISKLDRIECYDISNTQGTNPTGSLVVLTNGEIDKSQYRRFKIKKGNTPNDFAMMSEMLERRLRHNGWEFPDLIIVDGGKGQVSSALNVLREKNVKLPLIGLAKREETIIVPVPLLTHPKNTKDNTASGRNTKLYGENQENFLEISLPKNSGSLHLIMRIRDEAHRFAITYHRKLRGKLALTS